MVDTARYFLPLNALRRQIDGPSFSRMNVLHWHITDAQSTPYDSVAFPKFKQGAFHPGLTYTAADVAGVVEYARVRGVQVLLEVDMPGHNYAFAIACPELIVNCTAMYPLETEFWCSSHALYRGDIMCDFIRKLLTELTAVIPDTHFHIGGDEVQYVKWHGRLKAMPGNVGKSGNEIKNLKNKASVECLGCTKKLCRACADAHVAAAAAE